jgi:hypothetical protein
MEQLVLLRMARSKRLAPLVVFACNFKGKERVLGKRSRKEPSGGGSRTKF